MSKSLSIKFEKAVRILSEHMPPSDENSRKPVMFHDIRVGVYLYENGYSEDIVLAGVLHDAIEWSDVEEQSLRDEFGDNVVRLVFASTKDDTIADKMEKTNELIQRCVQNGQDALIVKTADIIDSFKWYSSQNNENELKNHCVKNANAILKFKPDDFDDRIFDELRSWQERFADNSMYEVQ
ncbi:MAG: HD domain-containing protein [Candidatus Moranbacteria bacterium]|nr:HD domain-containing protein [Candidatus Moranbacteria bacterium]